MPTRRPGSLAPLVGRREIIGHISFAIFHFPFRDERAEANGRAGWAHRGLFFAWKWKMKMSNDI